MASLRGRPLALLGLLGLVGLSPVGESSSIQAKLTDTDQQLGLFQRVQNETITRKSENRFLPKSSKLQSHLDLDPEFGI